MAAVLLAVLTLEFTLVMAQTTYRGSCPKHIETMEDFDIYQYLGRWHEYSRYSNTFEMNVRCTHDDYKLLPDGVVLMNNSKIYQSDLSHYTIGKARIVGPGKLSVRYSKLAASIGPVDYWVLGTDYNNYAVVYSCYNFAQVHSKFVWILMRHRRLTVYEIQVTHDILTKNFLALTTLVASDQRNCEEFF